MEAVQHGYFMGNTILSGKRTGQNNTMLGRIVKMTRIHYNSKLRTELHMQFLWDF